MTAPERFDWIWYGVDENGDRHVSLGRWQKHPCQFRYKFVEIQPTEHDHTRATPALDAAAMTPDVRALIYAAKAVMHDLHHGNGLEGLYENRDRLEAALRAFGGDT